MPRLGEVPRRSRAHEVNKGEARVALLLDANREVPHPALDIHIYGTGLGSPTPPPPGMVMVPCPAPCGSGWGGCGWVGMLVDGVVVFANDVESYGICKELY